MSSSNICFAGILNGDSTLAWVDPPCTDPVFGITAPLFLWTGCLVLLIFAVVQAIRLLIECVPIIRGLSKLTKNIVAIEPRDRPLDGIGLDQLNKVMNSSRLVSSSWREFEETLLIDTEDSSGTVFNTKQAEDFFSEESIIHGRVNFRFYSAFPSILTSIGLLLTFIAILIGLSHIHPDPAAQGKLTGVEELVYSLSGKFISSICALLLAVCFTFLEKRQAKLMSRAIHRFIHALNKRFNRKSAEHILLAIQKDIAEQSIAFRQFGGDLSGRLKESFNEGMGPHFQKVAEAVDELKKQKSESIVDSLGQVISEFKNALMGSTNSEFKTLETTLSRTAEMMSAMNEQSQKSQEKMSEVIQSLDAAVSKQSSTGQEHVSRLANTMEVVIEKLQSATTESSGTLASSVAGLLERVQQNSATQMNEVNRRNEELSLLMRGMLEQVQNSLSKSSSSVQETVTGVMQKSSEWTEKTTVQLNSVLQEQSKNAQSINDARSALDEALTTFRVAISDGSRTLTDMGVTSKAVKDGVSSLNSAVDTLAKTQDRVNDLASLVEKNAHNLQSVVERQGEIVTKYEQVVKELDKSLSHVLTQVTSSIENYSSRVKSSLETTLGQFDNHLGDATAKLGGTVRDLSESLEDLVDLATKSRGNGA